MVCVEPPLMLSSLAILLLACALRLTQLERWLPSKTSRFAEDRACGHRALDDRIPVLAASRLACASATREWPRASRRRAGLDGPDCFGRALRAVVNRVPRIGTGRRGLDGIGQPVQPGCQCVVFDSSPVSPPYVAMRPQGARATEPCAFKKRLRASCREGVPACSRRPRSCRCGAR